MNADGWVVISSKLDTKELEKELNRSLNELRKYEKEAEKLTDQKTKAEVDLQPYKEEVNVIREAIAEQEKLNLTAQERAVNERSFQRQLDNINAKYEQQINAYDTINGKIKSNVSAQEAVKNKVREMNEQLGRTQGFTSIKGAIDSIGHSMNGVINKVFRWGLAIFGIRSAYMGIRRAISIVSAENEGVANSFQQIRKVIAGALLPVVQTVINWIVKLMQYINIIWKFFTGKTLFNFADATKKSASELKKGAGSSGKIAKNLKDAKKQLAGFDEMNVLQDQEDTSGGGGGGGGAGDTDFGNIFDKLKDLPVPKWLQWILDHAPEIIALLAGITAGLIALKLGFTPLQALGIGLIVGGLVYALESLIKYLKDPSLENFGKIIIGIGIAVAGLGIAFLGLPVAIAGAIIAAIGFIIMFWDKIKGAIQSGIDWLKSKSDWVHKIFGDTIGDIYDTLVNGIQFMLNVWDDMIKQIKKIFDGIIKIVKGIINGDWKMAWEGAKDIFSGIISLFIDIVISFLKMSADLFISAVKLIWALLVELVGSIANIFIGLWNDLKTGVTWLWNGIKSIASGVASWINNNVIKPIVNFFTGLWNGIKTGASNAWTGVKNTFKTVATWFQTNVINKIVSKFKSLGTKVGSAIGGAFRGAVNAVLRTIENVLNSPIRAVNSLISVINKIPGVNIGRLSTFSLPRLAVGGIVNQPGRGVPLGGAITGERGAEGVIPLTDSQQMALLGEAIGRYITVNASITNTMNGRVISRELKKVQNEDNFAFNR